MRTGSHERARFAGRREGEFTWFELGASLPLISMDTQSATRQIVAWRGGLGGRRSCSPRPSRPQADWRPSVRN